MGMRPVAEMQFADFFSCAFDMITNFAAKSRYRTGVGVPLVIRGPSGGGVHGGPFHSQNPEAYFAHTPGPQDRAAGHRRRRQGTDQGRHPRRRPGALLRAQVPLPARARRPAGGRPRRPDREGGRAPRGQGPLDPDLRRDGLDGARRRGDARVGGDRRRGRGPAHAASRSTRRRSSNPSGRRAGPSCFTRRRGPGASAPRSPPSSPSAASRASTLPSCASRRRTRRCPSRPPLEEFFLPDAEKVCRAARALVGY